MNRHLMRLPQWIVLSTLVFLNTLALPPQTLSAAPVDELHSELNRIFSDEKFSDAIWGVQVESLDGKTVVYERNGDRLLIPASNHKLLVGASILMELGPDATFETQLYRTGPIEGGVLKGDLIVRGGGDPSVGGRFHRNDVTYRLRLWAKALKDAGIQRIAGSVVGDDNIFDDIPYGDGWQVDYLADWYAAEISALSFNDNCVDIIVSPNSKVGQPAIVTTEPQLPYLRIVNKTETVSKLPKGRGALQRVEFRRNPDSQQVEIIGSVLAGAKPNREYTTVPNPTLFTVSVFSEVLTKEGIKIDGEPQDIDSRSDLVSFSDSVPGTWTLVYAEKSPPLSDLLEVYLKRSQNLYGECFLKYLGHYRSKGVGSGESGIRRMREILKGIGVPPETYRPADGSGLSRNNLISAQAFCKLLQGMAKTPYAELFKSMLPESGKSGTLAGRMKNTAAAGKVFAKTGFIDRVRTLSGYIEDSDGEVFVFSFLANNYRTSVGQAQRLQDRACMAIADFSRKK